jgi:chemotaxis protein methyltransferase CheR
MTARAHDGRPRRRSASNPPGPAAPAEPDWAEQELVRLAQAVAEARGYDLRRYSNPGLAVRLRQFAHDERLAGHASLARRLVRDRDAFERLLLEFSGGPQDLFDEPEFYRTFRQEVAPLLATYPSIRIWMPGCGTGAGVWSLAIVLDELGLGDRVRIYATDPSELALERAARGRYPAERHGRWQRAHARTGGTVRLGTWIRQVNDDLVVRPDLARIVVFARHDIAIDGTFNEFQAIVCRDVIAGYRTAVREQVHERFLESLVRLGFLCLGGADSLPDIVRGEYVEFVPGARIHRRVSASRYEAVR